MQRRHFLHFAAGAAAGLATEVLLEWRLDLDFEDWTRRQRTPPERVEQIRSLFRQAPADHRQVYRDDRRLPAQTIVQNQRLCQQRVVHAFREARPRGPSAVTQAEWGSDVDAAGAS